MKLHQIFFASFYEPKKLAAFRLLPIGKMFQYVFLFIFVMTFVSFGRSIFDDLNEFEVADEVLEFGSALGALQYPITFVLALTVSTFYIFIRLSIVAAIGLGLLRLTNRRGDFRQIFQTTAFAATVPLLLALSFDFIPALAEHNGWQTVLSYGVHLIYLLLAIRYYPKLPAKK
ncbi:MAG TPA: DUF1189 family protein [Savagea sp.]